MTLEEFLEKYHLENWDALSLVTLFAMLDKLYLEYTAEQVKDIVLGYYEHADDIYNDMKERYEKSIQELMDLLAEAPKA